MRRLAFVVLVACSGAPAKSPTTPADWTARCAAHLDAARSKVALAAGSTKTETTPWNPSVRFEVHAAGGYYEAAVAHGRDACSDYDSDAPSFTNLAWSNGASASKVALDRIRRMNGDEGWVQADKVPRESIEPFRVAFEGAIEACLEDARAVPIGAVPKDFSCIDKADKCPDKPTPESVADGCPSR